MQIEHGQLNVGLECQAPSLGVFVHETQRVVALDVAPFIDGLLKGLHGRRRIRVRRGKMLQKRRFSTADVPFDDDGKRTFFIHRVRHVTTDSQ